MKNVTITNQQTKNDQDPHKKSKGSRFIKLVASIAVVGTVAALFGTAVNSSFGTGNTAGGSLRLLQSDNDVSVDDLKIFHKFI